jgi:hypothetical protein
MSVIEGRRTRDSVITLDAFADLHIGNDSGRFSLFPEIHPSLLDSLGYDPWINTLSKRLAQRAGLPRMVSISS